MHRIFFLLNCSTIFQLNLIHLLSILCRYVQSSTKNDWRFNSLSLRNFDTIWRKIKLHYIFISTGCVLESILVKPRLRRIWNWIDPNRLQKRIYIFNNIALTKKNMFSTFYLHTSLIWYVFHHLNIFDLSDKTIRWLTIIYRSWYAISFL